MERKGGEMKEYPAITFEIVHQREDGELERIEFAKFLMY